MPWQLKLLKDRNCIFYIFGSPLTINYWKKTIILHHQASKVSAHACMALEEGRSCWCPDLLYQPSLSPLTAASAWAYNCQDPWPQGKNSNLPSWLCSRAAQGETLPGTISLLASLCPHFPYSLIWVFLQNIPSINSMYGIPFSGSASRKPTKAGTLNISSLLWF